MATNYMDKIKKSADFRFYDKQSIFLELRQGNKYMKNKKLFLLEV